MPKFTITLRETVRYTVEVEAENEDEAIEAATELWADSADPTNDFCGQGQGVEVSDTEEENPFHPESPEGRAWEAERN